MSLSLKSDIEKSVADSQRMNEDYFLQQCKGLTSLEILNFYRNFYYKDSVCTEHGLVAAAINEILPTYTKLLEMQKLLYEGKINEAKERILK